MGKESNKLGFAEQRLPLGEAGRAKPAPVMGSMQNRCGINLSSYSPLLELDCRVFSL